MSFPTLVIGVDPGVTTGIVAIAYRDSGDGRPVPMVLQCHHDSALFFVDAILAHHPGYTRWLAIEQFVVGTRASRSSTSGAGRITRDLIGGLSQTLVGVSLKVHAAGLVKPWATDKRLEAAGLLEATKEMRHARDAARHALFCAVKQSITPDPLSTRLAATS